MSKDQEQAIRDLIRGRQERMTAPARDELFSGMLRHIPPTSLIECLVLAREIDERRKGKTK